jgi:hypothetical protein
MTSALTVQQRHLQLPDSCLFAPTELQISSEISQPEFSRLGKALASVDQASDLWACDYALAGQKRWDDEGLKLAATATKLSVGYLKTGARIAERFDPSRRYAGLTREHYRGICCFPIEFTDKWLPTVYEKGFGAKTLRALCVEAFGSDPKEGYTRKQNKKRGVRISTTLYAQFQERSPIPKVAIFIEQVLEDWMSTATTIEHERVAAALEMRGEWNHQRIVAERNRKKAEKLAVKEAAAARAKARYEERRAAREAEKAAREAEALARKAEVEAFRAAEQAKRDAEREQKRAQREAAQARRDAARERAEERARIAKLLANTVKGIQPSMYGSCSVKRVTSFKSMDEAAVAAEKYTAAKGYDFEGFACTKCGAFHIRADEVKFEAKRKAAMEARPTYAERRAAQCNPETKSCGADVL